MIARLFLLTLIVFCLQLGLFLVVLPWSHLWEHNYFLLRWPELSAWLLNYYLRGVISGLGLVDIGLGLSAAVRFRKVFEEWFEPAPATPVVPGESLRRDRIA